MTNILRFSAWVLVVLLLQGCEEKQTYSFYMQHPMELKREITECQSSFEKTKDQAATCEIVMYAAVKMTALINQQQEDPEKFGQRILDAQENYSKLQQAAIQARKTLDDLKQNTTSPAELRVAQDDLYKANKACMDQLQEIKALLAVVGLSSPG